ncbi:unnamed protein product [Cladocopium goreaui]|uniref:Transmembrane protein 189 n=1 Tax=Cladocopium goreaui TaxID=2562237 RepID=A0A9P1BX97_9DINO|nr:unnamed protein product [Cladocopium goreaui]
MVATAPRMSVVPQQVPLVRSASWSGHRTASRLPRSRGALPGWPGAYLSAALFLPGAVRRCWARCQMFRPSSTKRIGLKARRGPARSGEADDYFKPLVEGDVLSASMPQRCIVALMFVLLLLGFVKVSMLVSALPLPQVFFYSCVAILAGMEFADFGTGVYHFSVDNYGSAKTPVVGSQIEAFQGHHEEPWTITYRDFCNNCFPTCVATMPFLVAFEIFCSAPFVLLWVRLAPRCKSGMIHEKPRNFHVKSQVLSEFQPIPSLDYYIGFEICLDT